jgi:8-oxo-dGTP diphosphatase
MKVMGEQEQFRSRGRYTVIPRTLVFLTNGDDVLLLKGAPTKRLWAGRYNGLGGHVEPGETIAAAALREVREEAGIAPEEVEGFTLRALVNIEGTPQGVLLCIFTGRSRTRVVRASAEGTPEWVPIDQLDRLDLVDGDRFLPCLLGESGILYGHQRLGADGAVAEFTLQGLPS